MSDFLGFQIRVNLTLSGTVDFVPLQGKPAKPSVLSISFTNNGDGTMTGTVTLSPLVATDHVSSRMVVVTLNGTELPPIEAITNAAQFTCSDGDTGTVTDKDINAAGDTTSDPFPFTATLPLQPPTKPAVLGVTFSA